MRMSRKVRVAVDMYQASCATQAVDASRRSRDLDVARQRPQVFSEYLVEQRPGPPLAQPLDDGWAAHAEVVQDPARHERRTVESHAAVREDAMSAPYQLRAELRHRLETR